LKWITPFSGMVGRPKAKT